MQGKRDQTKILPVTRHNKSFNLEIRHSAQLSVYPLMLVYVYCKNGDKFRI